MRQVIVDALTFTVFCCGAVALIIAAGGLVIGLIYGVAALAKVLGMNTDIGYTELVFILCAVVAGVGYAVLLRLEK